MRNKPIDAHAFLLASCLCITGCIGTYESRENNRPEPLDLVNPYMGNISHLLVPTYPTVHLPNSMLRVKPERADYTGVELHGLPLMITGHRRSTAFNLSAWQGEKESLRPVINYSFDHENITPYSYSVYLDEAGIEVNYGLSTQSGIYEITFDKPDFTFVILHSGNGSLNWDGRAVCGMQEIGNGTAAFIYMLPEAAPVQVYLLKEGLLEESQSARGREACLVLAYPDVAEGLEIRYGISFINEQQARANLERELNGRSLPELHEEGLAIWNKALGKIRVQGGTEKDRKVFYTSLYRCYERPVCISEDGRYFSAYDGEVHEDQGRPFYTDDWIWDSYRAHHPLRILLDAPMEEDILHSFELMTRQMANPWYPTFPGIAGDARAMNSNHGVASVLDAHRKGLRNFSLEKSYKACKAAVLEKTLAPWSGKPAGELDDFYKTHGYIPALGRGETENIPEVHSFEKRQPVAVTLGTAYDQWCLAELAGELGLTDDEAYFRRASFNYRNLFNPETGFFHPKDKSGHFIMPFDYRFSGGMGAREYYDENNGWIYRWDVPHNIPDLIDLMGGRDAFVRGLDAMYSEPLGRSKYAFYAQLPDHTGNVGQFSMANEPSLHIPYLYNYAGEPWKTQKYIRKLLKEWFRDDLMGVPGDEDGGGMSAFVVFSQMGFYPVTPGDPVYTLGSPVFEKVSVDLWNGNTFEIHAKNASPDNKYIQSATLNGKILETPWFSHDQLSNGGLLLLELGPRANRSWGTGSQ